MRQSAAFALLASAVSGCSDTCQNSTVSTASALSGDLKAVLFQRACGATTGFSSQVSVTNRSSAPSGVGNAFVADTDHGAASAASWGGPWVELRWLSPQKLLIRYDAKARVFTQNARVSGVGITYEKVVR
jgi:hypothetical protein